VAQAGGKWSWKGSAFDVEARSRDPFHVGKMLIGGARFTLQHWLQPMFTAPAEADAAS
jgi:hypothetical protein